MCYDLVIDVAQNFSCFSHFFFFIIIMTSLPETTAAKTAVSVVELDVNSESKNDVSYDNNNNKNKNKYNTNNNAYAAEAEAEVEEEGEREAVKVKVKQDSEIPHFTVNCRTEANDNPKMFGSYTNEQLFRNVISDNNKRVFGFGFDFDASSDFEPIHYSFRGIRNHFIIALHLCFMHHLPLQLRPDDIWLIIAQGLAAHISHDENAEKLRKKFVDFDGKKKIVVRDDSLNINSNNNDWTPVLQQFSDGCRELTNTKIVDLMTCNFSTTSTVTQVASQCVLFKALSKYISFHTRTCSGIPEIHLIGEVSDWIKIQSKVTEIAEMDIDLDFWLKHLVPIVDNIVKTVQCLEENENENASSFLDSKLISFWDSIYHYMSMSGGSFVSGWSNKLFPYKSDGKKNSRFGRLSPGDFPASYSRCAMKWEYFGQEIDCGMYGGMFGVAQQKNGSGCITPVTGYIVGE